MRQAQQMTKNNKTDFVNIDSSDCIFDSITSVNNKSFTAKLNNYWYECDLYGNFLYKIKCQNLRRVKENLLLLKINNKEGAVDNDFNIVIDFEYSDLKTLDLENNFFKFRANNKWGVINKQKEIIVNPKYDKISMLAKGYEYFNVCKNGTNFIIDKSENIIYDTSLINLKSLAYKSDINFKIVEINGKYGLIDKNFIMIKPKIQQLDNILEKVVKFK